MKEFIKLVKELKKTPRGKALLFFGFYFIFFLLIAVFARLIPAKTNINVEEENKEDFISIREINGYNYAYKYYFNIDNNNITIDGKKNGEEEEFIYTLNGVNYNYYKNGTLYYSNGLIVDSPSTLLEIIDNIDLFLEKASYDSVVNYKSGKKVYRYIISSSTISNVVDRIDLDIEEIPNEIRITQNTDKIDEVEIVLNSYCLAVNKCMNNMSIKMSYDDFNNIGEITNNK